MRRREDGGIELADPLDTLDLPCYDMRALTRNLDFVGDVARHLTALGWDNYATDHEDANGQFEQNFGYADALTSCDRAIFFRYMVEAMAQERGLIATFMPKPFAHLTGNGCHMHMSLWKDEANVFDADPGDDPHGLGLSEIGVPVHRRPEDARQGLHRADRADRDLATSAWRSARRAPASTWAPVFVSYGYNNRTQMLRIPAAGRIEDRTVDGSCNPYLAATAVLAAGLDGIERGLDAGEPTTEHNLHELSEAQRAELGIELLPANLLDATRELEGCEILRRALGNTGARGLRRLLRARQARRVAAGPRADHAVGARPLPAAVLGRAAHVRHRRACSGSPSAITESPRRAPRRDARAARRPRARLGGRRRLPRPGPAGRLQGLAASRRTPRSTGRPSRPTSARRSAARPIRRCAPRTR